jgi:hypothetical protein
LPKLIALMLCATGCCLAQSGFVKSAGQAIPGATVTLVQNGQTLTTFTDRDGHYGFYSVAPGTSSVTVEMFGFETLKKDVDFGAASGPVNFEVQLKQSPFLQRMQQSAAQGGSGGGDGARGSDGGGASGPAGRPGAGRARSTDNAQDLELQNELNAQQSAVAPPGSESSNESFLVSGSLSPGMAQGAQADSGPDVRFGPGGQGGGPFGGAQTTGAANNTPGFGGATQGGSGGGGGFGAGGFGGGGGGRGGFGGPSGRGPGGQQGRRGQVAGAQFGNRRRQQQIRGQASFTLQNSALNAKPFSIDGLDIPQAAYAQSRFSLIVGGPLVLGKIVKDPKTQFFLTYFGTRSKVPQLFVENVPTEAERMGDFSQATQSLGSSATNVPVTIYAPLTHQPFPGNQIPANLLNPISQRLLNFYPLPKELGTANNYQFETASASNTDNVGFRLQRSVTDKDRISGNVQFQRRDGTSANAFGWADSSNGYGTNVTLGWTRNISPTVISNFQIRFNRSYSEANPYFSSLPDISAELGIAGTSTNPLNGGPPTLNFTNFGALSDGVPTLTRNQAQGFTEGLNWIKGLHNLSIGGGYTRADLSTQTDPNGRGTLNFTGAATSEISNGQVVAGTGYDLADFLLGMPQSSSIQYGQQTNYFLQDQWNLYAQDEWKVRSNLTLTLGLRYEYFAPLTEKYGRIADLLISPGFNSVTVVTPATPGEPGGLVHPDYKNFSPRTALAWKIPRSKQSTILRAGYGIYYNGQIYNSFIQQLAKQPPFAVASAVNSSAGNVLSYANAFQTATTQQVTNTYAIDPNYRTPYASTWNISIQRELGKGFFADVTYLGTKGTRLDVKTQPNEPPPGSVLSLEQENQLGNAVGFIYDQSNGDSIFHALQLRLNRRFTRGLSFQGFYQWGKSIDDSSTFGGAGNITTTAQNWLDLSAERGLSNFDIRHQFTMSFVWTSPIAGPGSHVAADGKVGRLLKDWQISGTITAQTGMPLTARVLGNAQQLAQTSGVGSERASATGEPIEAGSGFFNMAAFAVPATGTYGDAGRNTIPGPGLCSVNAALARSFTLSERRRLEFRLETTNSLNNVNYTNLYTVVNAANYGLASSAGAMRTLQAVVRFRF